MPAPNVKAAAEERLRKASAALHEANRHLHEAEREHGAALCALEDIEIRDHPTTGVEHRVDTPTTAQQEKGSG